MLQPEREEREREKERQQDQDKESWKLRKWLRQRSFHFWYFCYVLTIYSRLLHFLGSRHLLASSCVSRKKEIGRETDRVFKLIHDSLSVLSCSSFCLCSHSYSPCFLLHSPWKRRILTQGIQRHFVDSRKKNKKRNTRWGKESRRWRQEYKGAKEE